MTERFNGKVAIVTGASSGIGRASALEFARAGASVVVADVNIEGGEETVRQIEDEGGDATFVKTDVSNAADVESMVNTAVETYGRLDFALNNAGIEGELAPTAEYLEEAWDRVISINLTGVWRSMKYEIPAMLQHEGGVIVNTASILGLVGFATAGAYTAAKHGVVGITKVAALEYAEQGIRVNAVCPGFIETPMVMERGVKAGEDRATYEQLVALHPVKRLGTPEEIAQTVTWLCSDEASFVTGHALTVDGGYVAQ